MFEIYDPRPGRVDVRSGTNLKNKLFSKLLVVVLGPVSVEELVSVDDAVSALYGRKINILTCTLMV